MSEFEEVQAAESKGCLSTELQTGFEGIVLNGFVPLPETATIKEIKDFQEQAENMILELANASLTSL